MRVLLLGPYPPPWGGVQTNLVAIRRLLRERGHACHVINLTRHRQRDADDVYFPHSAAQVFRLLLRLDYDIAHIHIGGNVSTRLLHLSLALSSMPRSRSVLTLHSGGYPYSVHGRNARPASFRGFVFRRFDRIITVNAAQTDMFRRFGVKEERIRLIAPHAVTDDWRGAALPDAISRFIESHSPALVTVSGLRPEYDLPLQIDALGALRERHPRAGLLVVGTGEGEEEIRRHAAAKPYAEHVMLCGDVPNEVALRTVAASDVFLRTTHYDGDAISVREALHIGTPVVATDNGMRPAGVHLIPVGDRRALVESVEARLAEPRARRNGDRRVDDENIAAVIRLYEELLR
ncbi:MAG: glycosyltransferase family 4 protein [Acidobacteriota bacterium]|nr:glycosyltransferase family 4 protein [Acidobacteriota bacterium]